MKIKEIAGCNSGERVTFNAVVADIKILPKSTGGQYINLVLADCTGRIETPVWDNIEQFASTVIQGEAYNVSGNVSKWNGNVQIKNINLVELKEGEFSPEDFISSYTLDPELVINFENLIDDMKEPYRSIAIKATGALLDNKERFEDFLSCPSAEKHHGNKIGGLFLHTVGVISVLRNSCNIYKNELSVYGNVDKCINEDRLMLKAILHDVMKMNEYEYSTVIRRKPNKSLNHLVEGVSYLNEINKGLGNILTEEELDNISYAILSHHGQYGPYEPKNLEDTLLHLADMVDSRIVGEIEKTV